MDSCGLFEWLAFARKRAHEVVVPPRTTFLLLYMSKRSSTGVPGLVLEIVASLRAVFRRTRRKSGTVDRAMNRAIKGTPGGFVPPGFDGAGALDARVGSRLSGRPNSSGRCDREAG